MTLETILLAFAAMGVRVHLVPTWTLVEAEPTGAVIVELYERGFEPVASFIPTRQPTAVLRRALDDYRASRKLPELASDAEVGAWLAEMAGEERGS